MKKNRSENYEGKIVNSLSLAGKKLYRRIIHVGQIIILKIILCAIILIPVVNNNLFSQEITGSVSSGFQKSIEDTNVVYSFIGAIAPQSFKTDSLIIKSGFFNLFPVKRALFNDPPSVTSDSVVMALMDTEFKYTGTGVDQECVPVISFKNLPSWMTAKNNIVSGTVPAGCPDTSFIVIATDEGGLEDTLKVKVISVFQNRKPEITSHSEDSSFEGSIFTYVAKAEDPDLTIPKINFYDYPSWLTVSKDTIKGVPPENGLDTSFKVTATDGYLSDTITVSLRVIGVNNPPVITSPSFAEATELEEFSYTATAEDPETTPRLFFLNLPSWLKVEKDGSNKLKGTPQKAVDTCFSIIAIDDINADTIEVSVRIKAINRAPEIHFDSLLLVIINSEIQYPVAVEDPEGKAVIISTADLPPWLEFENDTIKGTAPSEESEKTFIIHASDGEKDVSLNVRIIVKISNNPPEFISDDELEISEDEYFSHRFIAQDPDSTPLTFKFISSLPDWISFSGDSICGISSLPLPAPLGLKVVVSDGQHADTQSVIITVTPVNDSPRILSKPDTFAQEGLQYSYQVRAEDEDDTVLVYELLEKTEGMKIDSQTGLITFTPSDTQTGTHNIVIIVSDPQNSADTQEFELTVLQDTKPWCEIYEIDSYSRKSIKISYQIFDNDSDKIDIDIFYQLSGDERWNPVTKITENLTEINYKKYKGSVMWHSGEEFPDTILDSVRIRIVPSDSRIGYSSESNFFKLDNSKPLIIEDYFPEGIVNANEIKNIEINFSGAKPDDSTINTSNIKIDGKISGIPDYSVSTTDSSFIIELKDPVFTADTVMVTLSYKIKDEYGKTLDGNGDDIFEKNKNDNYEFSFITALPGDFDKNGEVGFTDLSFVAEYWLKSKGGQVKTEEIEECGPAKEGTIPNFIIDNDSLFDYEDLGVFNQLWHWCYYQEPDAGKPLNKIMARSLKEPKHAIADLVIDLPKEISTLKLGVKDVKNFVSFRYSVTYDPADYQFRDLKLNHQKSDTQRIIIHAEKNNYGELEFEAAYLSATKPGVSGDFSIAEIDLTGKPEKESTIRVYYELVGSDHKLIEQGVIDLNSKKENGSDPDSIKNAENFTIVPNPALISFSQRSLDFKHDPSALSQVKSSNRGTIFIVPIDTCEKKVRGEVRIYDWFGNLVIKTPESEIVLDEKQKEIYLYWNGRNRKGLPVNKGIYNVVIRWKGENNNRVFRDKVGIK